jgi:hypothetical protein
MCNYTVTKNYHIRETTNFQRGIQVFTPESYVVFKADLHYTTFA